MGSRLELQDVLKTFVENVYFQPPASKEMNYPCIRYELSKMDTKYADNKAYLNKKKYQTILIDEDPDSEIVEEILKLPLCSFDRFYTSNNLNHWVFNLYF